MASMALLCASFHDVPLELDSGSSSSGMIRVSTTTSSSGDDVKGQRLGRGEHRPAFSSRLHSCPPTLSLASSALLHPPSLPSVALTSLDQVIRVPPPPSSSPPSCWQSPRLQTQRPETPCSVAKGSGMNCHCEAFSDRYVCQIV